jgi:hypothetical protein
MKKIFFLLVTAIVLKTAAYAQTPFYDESFQSPAGWELQPNWTVYSGMLQFSWTPTITNFDVSAISQEITLPETAQEIIVTQYLDVFAGGAEWAEIYLVNGSEENLLWEYSLNDGNWGGSGGEDLTLDISTFGNETVQIKFRTWGATSYNWNYWNIYGFTLTALLENDLAVIDLSGSTLLTPDLPASWEAEIRNLGALPQSDFTVQLINIKTGEVCDEVVVSDPINPQSSKYIDFQWQTNQIQNTVLRAAIVLAADDFQMNNISRGHFVRVDPGIECSILFWNSDNGIETITDPEKGDLITPAEGLMRVLDNAGFAYDYKTFLPNNLNDYNIIIATLGCYCLS